ncbi:MAG TPA: nucleoside monophosphate kinase [Candidatus Paceibacterota bacterium]
MHHTLIFIGKSGTGKGTQVKLLEKYLSAKDPNTPIIPLETGDFLRQYFASGTYSSEISKKITESGGLQPEFITVNMWSNFLLKFMKPDTHIFVDGTPRRLHEAEVFDSAVRFYDRKNPVVILINVPQDVLTERLMKRGRTDDTVSGIKKRMSWFEENVMPCVEYYRNNPHYKFVEIDGDQTVESVHADILKAIGI